MKKIFAFSNAGGGDGMAYAMAEDGVVLGSHYCSHDGFVPGDLGVTEGSRPDRHETYAKHCPEGYEMEFVPAGDIINHDGLQTALKLNQNQEATEPCQENEEK